MALGMLLYDKHTKLELKQAKKNSPAVHVARVAHEVQRAEGGQEVATAISRARINY